MLEVSLLDQLHTLIRVRLCLARAAARPALEPIVGTSPGYQNNREQEKELDSRQNWKNEEVQGKSR